MTNNCQDVYIGQAEYRMSDNNNMIHSSKHQNNEYRAKIIQLESKIELLEKQVDEQNKQLTRYKDGLAEISEFMTNEQNRIHHK